MAESKIPNNDCNILLHCLLPLFQFPLFVEPLESGDHKAQGQEAANGHDQLHGRIVRIIWGQKDWLYNKNALRLWHKNLPNAEIYSLPGAGRYIQEDIPEELENLITEFLDKNSEKTQN